MEQLKPVEKTDKEMGNKEEVSNDKEQHPPQRYMKSITENTLSHQNNNKKPLKISSFPSQPQIDNKNSINNVIELLDDDKEIETNVIAPLKSNKRKRPSRDNFNVIPQHHNSYPTISAGQASAQSRTINMPDWMKQPQGPDPIRYRDQPAPGHYPVAKGLSMSPYLEPQYITIHPGHIPTWRNLLPNGFLAAQKAKEELSSQNKCFLLSLVNMSEFTVTGVSPDGIRQATSIKGLRSHIRQFSREYGKAIFDRDDNDLLDGGRWRIPLGAYQSFFIYLRSLPNTVVRGIPASHLNIAMLGRQRMEKGFPSVKKLLHIGVPPKIANTLAPFQRGGVEFVYERKGRALIADDMGLGKTIQGIASMSIYHEDWPLLVLSPSTARYHWQNEFLNWLGRSREEKPFLDFGKNEKSKSDNSKMDDTIIEARKEKFSGRPKRPMRPLMQSEIHVLTSGNDRIIPSSKTKVVIISYGLAPKLAQEKKMLPGMFRSAIVDESHMLKNKKSQRTKWLMPLLQATRRCVLLSGTPAFARPIELWPQMSILGTSRDEWLTSEEEFIQKYGKGGGKHARAELHTLLVGTIMLRRMKADILKQLPAKVREQALIKVINKDTGQEFAELIEMLKQGKGALGKIAIKYNIDGKVEKEEAPDAASQETSQDFPRSKQELKKQVEDEVQDLFDKRNKEIEYFHMQQQTDQQMLPSQIQQFKIQTQSALRAELDQFYHQRMESLKKQNKGSSGAAEGENPDGSLTRKALLVRLYQKTGQAKIPFVVEMLKLWLKNPAKGKLCIFAHHVSVLDEIQKQSGLSNNRNSLSKFIRIDGSTNPKQRHEKINSFQNDPVVRIALLGITAAGVAVTLTASSTVWFAELFWTPALLIQAEDRCHRIGQQATVRCMYIVAKGTLDEILWKHVEKKFQDLAEFVEGKEKMNLVVHKKYNGASEYRKTLEAEEIDLDDEVVAEDEIMESVDELESVLHQDIKELEREEQAMISTEKVDPDPDPDPEEEMYKEGESKSSPIIVPTATKSQVVTGKTESAAIICLSDDDEPARVQKTLEVEGLHSEREFPGLKLYKMCFFGPSVGIEFLIFHCKLVVSGKDKKNARFRPNGKPSIGDVIVAVKDEEITPTTGLGPILSLLKNLMCTDGYLEFIFAEDAEFALYFKSRLGLLKGKSNQIYQKIPDLPTYNLIFEGTGSYGFIVESLYSAVVVTEIHPSRLEKVGIEGNPKVGDVLVCVNKMHLREGERVDYVKGLLGQLKSQGQPVEITFAAGDKAISTLVKHGRQITLSKTEPKARIQQQSVDPEVIELLD
mmetsp:Transcript_22862/g.26058  ORF Transcript_22862/g.26058 Transcript_22862/m.26058 type:complete len:1300 (+) Transcript_22862:141-4040(+)